MSGRAWGDGIYLLIDVIIATLGFLQLTPPMELSLVLDIGWLHLELMKPLGCGICGGRLVVTQPLPSRETAEPTFSLSLLSASR